MLETCRRPFDMWCARDRCFAGQFNMPASLSDRRRRASGFRQQARARVFALAPDRHMIGITNLIKPPLNSMSGSLVREHWFFR